MPPKEVDELRAKLDSFCLKGEKLRTFKGLEVMDRAFFPGGPGLFEKNAVRFPKDGTLILGSNFGNVTNFVDANGELKCRDEVEPENGIRRSVTWENLIPLLKGAKIHPANCFFSNVFPVLHVGNLNKLPCELANCWLRDVVLKGRFDEFFQYTLTKVRPGLVVALGVTHSARFLNSTWPLEQTERWAKASSNGVVYRTPGSKIGRSPVVTVPRNDLAYVATAIPHSSDKRNWNKDGVVSLLGRAADEASRISKGYLR